VTAKVMKAYPADKLSWKPHERSFTARELMMRFMGEQMVMAKLPAGGFPTPPPQQPVPEVSIEQMLQMFEQGYQEVLTVLKGVSENDFDNKSTSFFAESPALPREIRKPSALTRPRSVSAAGSPLSSDTPSTPASR